MRLFKGDEKEIKMAGIAEAVMQAISIQHDTFLTESYEAYPLGAILVDDSRAPLANAIKREIFISTFKEIFEAFVVAGTFESYLTVFRKVFGPDVDVEFTVPAPGKLNIDITATGLEVSGFVSRFIVDDQYSYDQIVDDVGDRIVFRTVKGFETQDELEQMLFELVPGGIYTQITLTVG